MRFFSILAASVALLLFAALPATAAAPPAPYFNGFESPTDVSPPGADAGETMFGAVRVPSGTNGVPSADGGFHAIAPGAGPFMRYGGYSSVWPTGGYTTSVDIYLDTAASPISADLRFDWSSAISDPGGYHRRDFVFSVGTNGTGGWVMSASNNAPGWPANPARDPYTITTTGWYTFEHRFYDAGSGVLAVDMSVIDSGGTVLKTWTLSDPTDIIGVTVGGNRYGWLVTNAIPNLPLDNITRNGADAVPPAITISTPADGAIYALNAAVVADYECVDNPGGSGIATCAGPVADGAAVDTATAGAFAFTVAATDVAGNAASATNSYTVVADKDQCKKGGWQSFTAPIFKNQGDCVSYFASKGKAKGNP